MSLVELVQRLFQEERYECISCWVFPETVIERDFQRIFDLQEAVAEFGEVIRKRCEQIYGNPAQIKKTTGECIAYRWQMPSVEVTYTLFIAQKEEGRAVYNATLYLRQIYGGIDLQKASAFLQDILKKGVVANGPEHGAYMLSRAKNGRIESAYKQTAEELGLSIKRSCEFVPNKGWVYSATKAA